MTLYCSSGFWTTHMLHPIAHRYETPVTSDPTQTARCALPLWWCLRGVPPRPRWLAAWDGGQVGVSLFGPLALTFQAQVALIRRLTKGGVTGCR